MKNHSKIATSAFNKLQENKLENIRQLIAVPMEKLIELKKYYSNWAREAREAGYTESEAIN